MVCGESGDPGAVVLLLVVRESSLGHGAATLRLLLVVETLARGRRGTPRLAGRRSAGSRWNYRQSVECQGSFLIGSLMASRL